MPDKEWLNEIKRKVVFVSNGYWNGINMDDLKLLIEEAEQSAIATENAIKLGKKIEGLQSQNIQYCEVLDRKNKIHEQLNKDYITLKDQNKYYREKLREIMLKEHECMEGYETDSFAIVKEALELSDSEVRALLEGYRNE